MADRQFSNDDMRLYELLQQFLCLSSSTERAGTLLLLGPNGSIIGDCTLSADDIEAALRRAFGPLLRHQANRVGRDPQRDVEHLLGRRHFKVQRGADFPLQARHIRILDVAAVFPQMGGDAVRARRDRLVRGADRVGARSAARVAHGRDVIDVDAKPQRPHGVAVP